LIRARATATLAYSLRERLGGWGTATAMLAAEEVKEEEEVDMVGFGGDDYQIVHLLKPAGGRRVWAAMEEVR
jgi:hypothetical protein